MFHAVSHPGVMPDNDIWVARKRKTVLRWGMSSWAMRAKMGGTEINQASSVLYDVEGAFANKYALGATTGEYAIHGGGVPLRVEGVEGVVGVIVVSGLKQEEDHMVVIEALEEFIAN